MLYTNAVRLKKGDTVYYVNGKNKPTTKHTVVSVEQEKESKDVFVRCEDGKLYHHTALKQ